MAARYDLRQLYVPDRTSISSSMPPLLALVKLSVINAELHQVRLAVALKRSEHDHLRDTAA
jgi:hypothetical protein